MVYGLCSFVNASFRVNQDRLVIARANIMCDYVLRHTTFPYANSDPAPRPRLSYTTTPPESMAWSLPPARVDAAVDRSYTSVQEVINAGLPAIVSESLRIGRTRKEGACAEHLSRSLRRVPAPLRHQSPRSKRGVCGSGLLAEVAAIATITARSPHYPEREGPGRSSSHTVT